MALTIGKLARRFNLSRSTLLYYDSISLLSPSARGGANYRLYSESDCKRLEQIAMYRQAGLSLRQIKDILDSTIADATASLEAKLDEINQEINMLRQQQHFIIEVLQNSKLLERVGIISKDELVELLQAVGVDGDMRRRLHNQFETKFPEKHGTFLQLLELSPGQVAEVRERARCKSDDIRQG